MDSNTLLIDHTVPKIGHKLSQLVTGIVHVRTGIIPLVMACKYQKQCIKPVFFISQFRN